jgi:hypothetical protein
MPDLVKYALLSLADLTIIGVLFHYLLARLRWYTPVFTPLDKHYGNTKFRHLSYFDQLKRISYFAVVVVGLFICLHGAFDLLFSWMPHRWGRYTEEGEWVTSVRALSMLGAFFGGVALLAGLENTAEKVSKLQKLEAFYVLLKSEVGHFESILRWPTAARIRPTAADLDRRIDRLAADHIAKVEQEIKEAKRSGAVCFDDARICDDLIGIFRLAMKEEQR